MQNSKRVVAAGVVVLVSLGVVGRAAAQPSVPAVRSESPVLRNTLLAGCQASSSFRSLGDRVSSTGGVVHIESGRCPGQKGCLLHWMVTAGARRYLRVHIDITRPRNERIATIGHELQHVIEVLEDPAIRTAAGVYWRFSGALVAGRRSFDTAAAIAVGQRIHDEMKRLPARDDDVVRWCAERFTVDEGNE